MMLLMMRSIVMMKMMEMTMMISYTILTSNFMVNFVCSTLSPATSW